MKIGIDAGHGFYTSGKRVTLPGPYCGMREWYLNSVVANYLQGMLELENIPTLRLDDVTGVRDLPLSVRAGTANEADCDLVFCIHHNAGKYGGLQGGPVVFHNGTPERAQQARYLYDRIVGNTHYPGDRSAPVQAREIYMISHTKMPCFYIERLFMDATTDLQMLLDTSDINAFCRGIYHTILAWTQEGWC